MASWSNYTPPMPNAVRMDALRRAAQVLGSVDALARTIGFSPRQIERWLQGEEGIPTDVFLLAVDLIENSSSDAAKRSPPGGNGACNA